MNARSASSPTTTSLAVTGLALPPDFDLLRLHRLDPARYPCLLESVAHGTAQGRYDVVGAFPGECLVAEAGDGGAGPAARGFLDALDRAFDAGRPGRLEPLLPAFRGGWFIYLAYEMAAGVEPRLALPVAGDQPLAWALRLPVALVRDRHTGRAWAVAEPDHAAALKDLERDLAAASRLPRPVPGFSVAVREPDPAEFLAAVARARDAIGQGEIYQANLSREWTGELDAGIAPWEVYARLRQSNPAPFAALAVQGDLAIASSSPERLVRVADGSVETRPIAGTRPRLPAGGEDARQDLLASPKERAEHVMLIDLERNDLGRICLPGTVTVDEYMAVESYSHVHHIVSNVRGRLAAGVSPGQVLRAVFPGGTITGCPKVRCMEIIAALEGRPRGPYTGSLGYLNRDGSMDLNILIRSIVMNGRRLSLAAGAGIVADSEPGRELEETRAKAKGMLLALAGPAAGVPS